VGTEAAYVTRGDTRSGAAVGRYARPGLLMSCLVVVTYPRSVDSVMPEHVPI